MSKEKNAIRLRTRHGFTKKGICKLCGATGETTWHHFIYKKVLTKHDVIELCKDCHIKIDKRK